MVRERERKVFSVTQQLHSRDAQEKHRAPQEAPHSISAGPPHRAAAWSLCGGNGAGWQSWGTSSCRVANRSLAPVWFIFAQMATMCQRKQQLLPHPFALYFISRTDIKEREKTHWLAYTWQESTSWTENNELFEGAELWEPQSRTKSGGWCAGKSTATCSYRYTEPCRGSLAQGLSTPCQHCTNLTIKAVKSPLKFRKLKSDKIRRRLKITQQQQTYPYQVQESSG